MTAKPPREPATRRAPAAPAAPAPRAASAAPAPQARRVATPARAARSPAEAGPVLAQPPRWAAWMGPRAWERLGAYALLTRQDRPVGWLLLLWPTYWGLWLAAGGLPPLGTLAIFTVGVIVMRSAGCAINDWADRWLDPQVERTRERPLASGRVSPREALLVFLVLALFAFGLVMLTNARTVQLSFAALALAVVYPFVKRRSYVPQLWLGMAFGMSIPMAWTAVTGEWPAPLAWLLFAANILWSTAYDTLYAMVDREDDIRAGARSTAILFGDLDLVAVGIVQSSFLLAMWFAGEQAGLGRIWHVAFGFALLFSAWQVWHARSRWRDKCFEAFHASHWVGALLFLGIALDLAFGGHLPKP
jgi:4-hydroxybenzoate polyprenyltransferase